MKPSKPMTAGIRLGAMIIDHFVMSLFCMLFFIPAMARSLSSAFTVSHEHQAAGIFTGSSLYIAVLGISLYFCKDCIKGRSAAKRLLNLQVVDNQTGQVASPLQCFVRNIFCIIWPIELIITLVNPERRIGDHVAGTKVVYYDPVHVEQPALDYKKLITAVALSFMLMFLLMWSLRSGEFDMPKVKDPERTNNVAESKLLEKMYQDRMHDELTASVRVYNKIDSSDLVYISLIFTLKENYLEDPESAEKIKKETMQVLYTRYPENAFTGQAQYVYKSSSNTQISSNSIGTKLPAVK